MKWSARVLRALRRLAAGETKHCVCWRCLIRRETTNSHYHNGILFFSFFLFFDAKPPSLMEMETLTYRRRNWSVHDAAIAVPLIVECHLLAVNLPRSRWEVVTPGTYLLGGRERGEGAEGG